MESGPNDGAEVIDEVLRQVRPVFVLVAAWVMATAQVLRKHTATLARYNAFVLLPAYHIFYQGFLISALFFVSQRHNREAIESGAMTRGRYAAETDVAFGFVKDPEAAKLFVLKAVIVFTVSGVAGIVAAFVVKNNVNNWRPNSLKEYRRVFTYYSAVNIAVCLLTYFIVNKVFSERA